MARIGKTRALTVAAAVLAGCAVTASLATAGGRSEAQSQVVQQLAKVAGRMAGGSGEPAPTAVRYAKTRLHAISAVDGDRAAYRVVMRGRFTAYWASPPAGAPPPRGSVLTLVVAAHGYELVGIGVSDKLPNLERSGAVHTIPASAVAPWAKAAWKQQSAANRS